MSSQLIVYIVFSVVLHHRGLGTVNFALYKSAVQSTTLDSPFNWTADKAVDGNSDGSDPDNFRTCSSTKDTISPVTHTWEVDIGFQIIVKTITIYGRTDKSYDQLRGFKLYLGNVSKPWIYNQEIPSNSSSNTIYVFKPNDAIASVISLKKEGTIFAICEVTVEGECLGRNFSQFCNLTCGACYAYQPCNQENGTCPLGCDQGWKGTICKEGTLQTPVGPNTGVIVGSVLAGMGIFIFAVVILIVVVKNRRKTHTNATSTDNVTTAAHYANVIVGNPDAVCKITTRFITEKDNTYSANEEAGIHRGMSIGVTNSRSGVMEPDVPVLNVYETLQDGTGSNESAYRTIDHNRINDQEMESMKTCCTYIETLQSLESTLKGVEEEIRVLLDKKEQFLYKELETARGNKLRDKKRTLDVDTDKGSTIVNYVQALQSIEGELRILEEKRKCLLGKKEILLRQELAKTTENEK